MGSNYDQSEERRLIVATHVAAELEPILNLEAAQVERDLWVSQFRGQLFERLTDGPKTDGTSRTVPMLTADANLDELRFHIRLGITSDGPQADRFVECGFRVGPTGWQPLDVAGLLAFNIDHSYSLLMPEPADQPRVGMEPYASKRPDLSTSEAAGFARDWLQDSLKKLNVDRKIGGEYFRVDLVDFEGNEAVTHVRATCVVVDGKGKGSRKIARNYQRLNEFFNYHQLDIKLPPNADGTPPQWSIVVSPRLPEGFKSQFRDLAELIAVVTNNEIPATPGHRRVNGNGIESERARK